jgi:1-acyl-sn-glycerol-3-phosphate acyltransferase
MDTSADHTLPGEAPPSVRRMLGTRLWFVWAMGWAVLDTLFFAVCSTVAYHIRPSPATFQWWCRRWSASLLGGMGMQVQVSQEEALPPDQPHVYVVNHQNALDIPVLGVALPHPFGYVAKAELERVPFLGAAIRFSPSVFVDRRDARRSLESLQRAGAQIRAGSSVVVFAEGYRSYRHALNPFKKGAFMLAVEAGVPLVPVVVHDSHLRMDERYHTAQHGMIHVTIGTPLPMAGLHRRDVPAVMEQVCTRMEAMLGSRG